MRGERECIDIESRKCESSRALGTVREDLPAGVADPRRDGPETAAGFGEIQLAEGCCLCFSEQSWSPYPGVRQLACDQVDGCLSWTRSRDLAPPQRYFIPEDRGTELEEALRTREAALRVTISDDGTLAIDRLYLDGEPWRP